MPFFHRSIGLQALLTWALIMKRSTKPGLRVHRSEYPSRGLQYLSGYMSEFQKSISGGKFVMTDFKEHYDRSVAHWDMVNDKGTMLAKDVSFAVYGADGRLKQIRVFDPPNVG
jgi:hypothetical protein